MSASVIKARSRIYLLPRKFFVGATTLCVGSLLADGRLDFFEERIRPVLVEYCYSCHSAGAEKLKGGLYLDSRAGMLKGGDSGPAIERHSPEKSLLLRAISGTDDELQMPPKKRLSQEQIADFRQWIQDGATDPRTEPIVAAKDPISVANDHWAFQAPKAPAVPEVQDPDQAKTPIDNFVLARLDAAGLSLSAPADKRTLLRRVTYDLTGLPPTQSEIKAFEADASYEAFARAVDRLLASEQYGVRWARHWLDIARYADVKDHAFTYRDWVIRALNDDLPYDQFILQQIAADKLTNNLVSKSEDQQRSLAALGFLTVGRGGRAPEKIDDQIDVITRGLMGLTVSCARCHDHKYEPIPTEDYYSLYGILANSTEPKNPLRLPLSEHAVQHAIYQQELQQAQDRVNAYKEEMLMKLLPPLRRAEQIAEYLMGVYDTEGLPVESVQEVAAQRALSHYVLGRWKNYLNSAGTQHEIFGYWRELLNLEATNFAASAAEALEWRADSANPLVVKAFPRPPASLREAAYVYGKLLASHDQTQTLSDEHAEALRQVLRGREAPPSVPLNDAERFLMGEDKERLRVMQQQVDKLKNNHPGAPRFALTVQDAEQISPARVFIRGNSRNPGQEVPRRFLEVLSGPDRQSFQEGSGRLELARAIATPENPLTARVAVNRVWLQLFGRGLVRTASDFGLRGDRPTHPELLDWLALRFVADGWSLKKLHRLILTSAVYHQSSEIPPVLLAAGGNVTLSESAAGRALRVDPENRLLWRMNRRRLDFESLRDSILHVSGQLERAVGGRPEAIVTEPFSRRRTIYGLVDRANLPELFRIFDFANPDLHSAQRYATTVPQQALYLMNHPFIIEQAQYLAESRHNLARSDRRSRVEFLYAAVFGRAPSRSEMEAGLEFLSTDDPAAQDSPVEKKSVWQYGYGEYDPLAQRVKQFRTLPYFDGEWKGGPALPDPVTGWCIITPSGGRAGDLEHCSIRRWTAPRAGTLVITGVLQHTYLAGDGVRGRIVSSRTGELAAWRVQKTRLETNLEGPEIQAGDTVDFIVDSRTNNDVEDLYSWAPHIQLRPLSDDLTTAEVQEFDAVGDFRGPPETAKSPLNRQAQYAQTLLLSNEFMFVD